MLKNKKLLIVILINIVIFFITNILFNIKYEQVDDFIIYNLYSGLDGTYNIHGIYMHPIICFILSIFFRIIPAINWHTIFLLLAQFMCFTIIGYIIISKHNNNIAILLYTIFACIFYTTLLLLLQYTSVSALLILTSFILLIHIIEQKENCSIKYIILMYIIFTLGILTRLQSVIIILPFYILYLLTKIIIYLKNKVDKDKIIKLIKHYGIYMLITIVTYISTVIIYNSDDVYKEYIKYNNARNALHDIIYVDYEENKEIFDEIGWSKNDHYMFYTFGFGDENIFSKEKIEKLYNYKIEKDGKYNFNKPFNNVKKEFISETTDIYTYIFIFLIILLITNLFINDKNRLLTITICIITLGLHFFFIYMGRSMMRVIIPEYIIRSCLINILPKIR